MIIDTHAHLNLHSFEKDRFSIIESCLLNNISLINVGTNFSDSKLAVEIAEKYNDGVYATVGIHPSEIEDDFDFSKIKELAAGKKVVAIGEIGLDYFYPSSDIDFAKKQKQAFLKQLEIAEELNLPIVIHSRDAFDDLYEILKTKKLRGVIHCFSGDVKELERFLALGYYIGFNGIIFKADLDEVIKKTPNDRILIETDCPFLTPPDFYEKRNNPMSLKIIEDKIFKIKGENISKQIYENSLKLFNI